MSGSVAQSDIFDRPASFTFSFGATPTINNEVVVFITGNGTDTPSSLSDNQASGGNTYTLRREQVFAGGGGSSMHVYTAKIAKTVSNPFTITANGISVNGHRVVAVELAGTDTSAGDSFDSVSAATNSALENGNQSSITCQTTAVAATVSYLVAVTHNSSGTTMTPGGSASEIEENTDVNNGQPLSVAFKSAVAGAGTVNGQYTMGASVEYGAITITFKEAANFIRPRTIRKRIINRRRYY